MSLGGPAGGSSSGGSKQLADEAATAALGAFQDKEPGNHGTMWEMILTVAKAS